MRSENIEVTFKIPIPVDKPDLNGVIYSKDAIKNAYKNVKNVPIEIPNDKGKFLPIGVCQEAELIEDEKGDYEVLTEDGYLHIIEERIEIDTVKEEIRL